jgi:hypothetical protein
MATEDGREQTKVKRSKPVKDGTNRTDGSGGQVTEGRSERTISNLEAGMSQLIQETNEHAFAIQKLAFVMMEKCRQYAQELDRIKSAK